MTPVIITVLHCYRTEARGKRERMGASLGDLGLNSVSDPFRLWEIGQCAVTH